MKKFAAGLAVSALAASATVVTFTGTALAATSPTCTATAYKPELSGGHVQGDGFINCTQLATYTLTIKLWRNNANGKYSSWTSKPVQDIATADGGDAETTCTSGGTRQWHTEAIISWKIYNGSALIASGSGYDNSSDADLSCQ